MDNVYLLYGSIAGLLLVMMAAMVVPKVRYARRRKALEQLLVERDRQSGQALVRYVMLNRHCSEEVAYQRLAAFVNKHVPFDDQSSFERMFIQDRQSLVESAQRIVVHEPNEIDKI